MVPIYRDSSALDMLHETSFSISISKNVKNISQQICVMSNILYIVKPSSKHVGPLGGPCLPSPRSDQNFKMVEDEKDYSGEIYGRCCKIVKQLQRLS